MASFLITHTDGTTYTSIGEGVVDDSLGLYLVGQNYHNYGQLINNNFLRLLENQANGTPPKNPQAGQLWWNTSTQVLSFFDGAKFKPCSSSAVSNSTPLKPLDGDQWWDTNADQFKVYNGTDWITVGPLYTKGQEFSGILPTTVVDVNSQPHLITELQVSGTPVVFVNNDPDFILPVASAGVTNIVRGLTLAANTTISGTATNSLKLNGIAANNYIRTDSASSVLEGSLTVHGLAGISVGINPFTIANNQITSPADLTLRVGSGALTLHDAAGTITVTAEPTVANSITTKSYVDSSSLVARNSAIAYTDTKTTAIVNGAALSNLNTISNAINNDPHYSINVQAAIDLKADANNANLTGTPRATTTSRTDSSTRIATTAFVQDLLGNVGLGGGSSGSAGSLTVSGSIIPNINDIYDIGSEEKGFHKLYGTAVHAAYADLAELYDTDALYLPGTVVVFGGKEEITVSDRYCDTRIAGVMSTNPAYLMNDNKKGSAVALTGKVPCKVTGAVKKGDLLVNSEFAGVAMVMASDTDWKPGCVIGKSLEDNDKFGIRDVMIVVGRF